MKKVFMAMCLVFMGLCFSAKGMNGMSFGMNFVGVQCFVSKDRGAFMKGPDAFQTKAIHTVQSDEVIGDGFQKKNVAVLNRDGKCGKPSNVVGMFTINSSLEPVNSCSRDSKPSKSEMPDLLLFSLNLFLLMMILTMTVV